MGDGQTNQPACCKDFMFLISHPACSKSFYCLLTTCIAARIEGGGRGGGGGPDIPNLHVARIYGFKFPSLHVAKIWMLEFPTCM